jgi:nicotinate-nucleotide adenylyltransferase
LIALFGGTFDPIHNGHLHAANAAATALRVECVNMVLAARPKHRPPPIATVQDRWAMLELALAGEPRLRADDREVRRENPSYTVDTLEDVRTEAGSAASIAWIVGFDAFRELPSWHRWRDLLGLGHLVVLRRPGHDDSLDRAMQDFTQRHRTDALARLHDAACGCIYFVDAEMLPISSTDIRAKLARGEDVLQLLPSAVSTYITNHRPYRGPAF